MARPTAGGGPQLDTSSSTSVRGDREQVKRNNGSAPFSAKNNLGKFEVAAAVWSILVIPYKKKSFDRVPPFEDEVSAFGLAYLVRVQMNEGCAHKDEQAGEPIVGLIVLSISVAWKYGSLQIK